MAGGYSKKMMQEVAAAFPADGAALIRKELHARIGQWSPISIKHAVRQLVEEGRVERLGDQMHPTFRLVVGEGRANC